MNQILSAKNLYKTFRYPKKVEILQGIDLVLHSSKAIAITGSSGEGKTTLLHILGALEKPDRGEIEICGKKLNESDGATIRKNHIGFIFQSFNLLEDCSALENVLIPARIARKKTNITSASYQEAIDLITLVGLQERASFPLKLLSGGEKQRIAIARAFLNNPDLILADEPSGNLDHENSIQIHRLLLDAVKSLHKSLIIVTHDIELAKLCDKIFILKKGKLYEA